MPRQRLVARFGPFEFDFDRGVLREGPAPIRLQPRPTAVLALLLREPGRLVTREEIRDAVWQDRVLEFDAALNFSVRQIRRVLRDEATTPTYVETVHRRGYRLIAPVQIEAVDAAEASVPVGRPSGRRFGLLAMVVVPAVLLLGYHGTRRARVVPPVSTEASLTQPTRATFQAAQYLYDQGDMARALTRLDSVRLAAPDYAEAWALTSLVRLRLGDIDAARSAGERAVQADPTLAKAHYALGRAYFMQTRPEAMASFRQAVELDPNEPSYRHWYAETLANALRFDEAIRELETVRSINAVANTVATDLASVYLAANRVDEALNLCARSLELAPENAGWARDCLMTAHFLRGETADAVNEARALMALDSASDTEMARVETTADYFRWNLAEIDSVIASGTQLRPFARVRATARLQERDETLDGLRSMRRQHDPGIQWIPRDIWFRFLHGDPEFDAFLREAGLPIPEGPEDAGSGP